MHAILAVIWSWDGQWSWATKAPLNCQALAFNASSLSCHGGSSVGISMEVGRWSSRPSLMTPKPARKGRDRSWLRQLVPNQVQLSRWRSKSAWCFATRNHFPKLSDISTPTAMWRPAGWGRRGTFAFKACRRPRPSGELRLRFRTSTGARSRWQTRAASA